MNYNLDVGVNLDNRTIYLSIPSGTSISEVKTICRTDKGNTIYENSTGGYYHTDDLENDVCFYDSNTNVDHIKLPDDFGTIIEIDNTSVLYEYIERVSHEKVYVTSEDYAKQESMSKDDIEAEIEEGVRSYGVPLNSVMGFDGTASEIPNGYEVTTEPFPGAGSITVNDNYSTSTTEPYSANYVNNLAGDVLWTNPNPNAVFGSTTISITNKNDYTYFEVFAKNYYLDGYKNSLYTKFENGYNGYLMEIDTEGSLITRRVINTTNGFTFDNAYYKRYSSTSAATTDNNRAIPIFIIGYKTNIFV